MSLGTVGNDDATALALLAALRHLAGWATGANRTGNPYCHKPVIDALKAIKRAEGFDGHWTDALRLAGASDLRDCAAAEARVDEQERKEGIAHERQETR